MSPPPQNVDNLHLSLPFDFTRRKPCKRQSGPTGGAAPADPAPTLTTATQNVPYAFTTVSNSTTRLDWVAVGRALKVLLSGDHCNPGDAVASLLNSPEPPASAGPGPRACWVVVQQMGQISALVQERAVTPLDDPLGHLTAGA